MGTGMFILLLRNREHLGVVELVVVAVVVGMAVMLMRLMVMGLGL